MAQTPLNPVTGRVTREPGSEACDWDRPEREASLGKGPMKDVGALGVGEQIKEQAGTMVEGAKDLAADAKAKVQEAVQAGTNMAEQTREAAGHQMHAVADKIRQGGDTVSQKADQFGTYLQEHDFSAIGRDLTDVVRRYPLQSLLIGIGIGLLLGRAAR